MPAVPALAEYAVSGKADLDVKVAGRPDAPELAGTGRVTGLGATVSGLAVTEAALTLSFDPKRVKAALSGKLAGAAVALDVDAKDYAKTPDVRVTGKLASLDLTSWAARKEPAPPLSGSAPAGAPQGKAAADKPLSTSGRLEVGPVKHPNFQAESAVFDWALTGITPDLGALGGKATLKVGKGRFDDLAKFGSKHPLLKAALFPLIVLQKTAGIVKLPLPLPNFDKVAFSEITGDYAFAKGLMTVKESHMDAGGSYVTTTGTADLARDKLDLRIAVKLGGLLQGRIAGPLAFFVRGSLANPETKPDVAAIIKQPGVEQVIDQGKKLLEGIFKR